MSKIRSSLFALAVAASATVVASAGAQSTAPANGQRIERSQSDSAKWKGHGRAEHRRDREMKGDERREERGEMRGVMRGVKPTDAQKAQIKAIHQKYKAQFKSFRDSVKPAMDEARAARQRGDTAAARAAFAKTAGVRQQAQALRQQELGEIRGVLTPEQQKTLDANIAQRKAHGDHDWKARGGRRMR